MSDNISRADRNSEQLDSTRRWETYPPVSVISPDSEDYKTTLVEGLNNYEIVSKGVDAIKKDKSQEFQSVEEEKVRNPNN